MKIADLPTSSSNDSLTGSWSGRQATAPDYKYNEEKYQLPQSVSWRDIRSRLDSIFSRKLIDIGFSKLVLVRAIRERLARTGDDFPSFMDYFMAVKRAEAARLIDGQLDTMSNYYREQVGRICNPECPIPNDDDVPASQSAGSSRYGMNECKICMNSEVDTVFLPCKHMCSCSACADKLARCGICRKTIDCSIKVRT